MQGRKGKSVENRSAQCYSFSERTGEMLGQEPEGRLRGGSFGGGVSETGSRVAKAVLKLTLLPLSS